MDIKTFEKAVQDIDLSKYHICRMLGMEDGKFQVVKWQIFRKDMPDEQFFSDNNVAVLSSEYGDTLEDIERLVKQQNSKN